MKLKGLHFADVAEIQEAVTDELKKVQKRNFQQLFSAKACIYANGDYFVYKKCFFLTYLLI
jgi:imidazolonepropionase-like amidohydrolase